MKKFYKFVMLVCFLSIIVTNAQAYDFAVQNSDGKTIYYRYYTSSTTVAVTYGSDNKNYNKNLYYGSIKIPSMVTYEGNTYSVTAINSRAFDGCTNLTSIEIPNSVTHIWGGAFDGCSGLQKVIVKDLAAWCNITYYYSTDNPLYYAKHIYSDENTEIVDLKIPSSVTSIRNYAFYGCESIYSCTIPAGVLSIGTSPFSTPPTKVIWLTNTPPEGYANAAGIVNYVGNDLYTSLSNKTVYPYLSSMFDVNGIRYVPISMSDRTCDAIDCNYDVSAEDINIGNTVTYRGVELTVNAIKPYTCFHDDNIRAVDISYNGDIPEYAFSDCANIGRLNCTNQGSIGETAFAGCTGLTSVALFNQGLISNNAFSNSAISSSLEIGSSVTTINSNAFNNIGGGFDATIANNGDIANSAFSGCTGLRNLTCENNGNIGESAFSGCTGLRNLTCENNGNIGESAFSGCTNLQIVTLKNQGNIGASAFENAAIYKTLNITSSIVNLSSNSFKNVGGSYDANIVHDGPIPENAFYQSTGLHNLTCTNKGNIEAKAFYGCTGLNEVTLSNQGDIGVSAFEGSKISSKLEIGSSIVNISNNSFKNITGSFDATIANEGAIPDNAFSGSTGLRNLVCSNRGDIGASAFYGCTGLSNVTLSNQGNIGASAFAGSSINGNLEVTSTITNIGSSAFQGIGGSFNATIDTRGAIPDNAFLGSTGLKEVSCTNKGEIGLSAFNGCTNLLTATLSNKGNIGTSAFMGCTSLRTVTLSNKGVIGESAFNGCSSLRELTFSSDNAFTSIGAQAFRDCSSLPSVEIPDKVTTLGTYAFYGCSRMASAKIGTGITSIGTYTFSGCSNLTDLQIGENTKNINAYAFQNCSSLEEILFPKAVTSIGNYAVSGCKRLKRVIMEDGNSAELTLGSNGSNAIFSDCPLDSVYIGRNITYNNTASAGYSPFYMKTTLRAVRITDNETQIANNEYYGCTNLMSVYIGNGVTTIGNWAFAGCSSLDFFAVGSSVATIGEEAFSDCTAMTRLISQATTPPVCGSNALNDINKWECTLSIPESAVTAYQQANQWKEFLFINNEITGFGDPSVAVPTFTPAGGTYNEVLSVAISCTTEDVVIYYTTDGTNPTTSSNVYSEPITVEESMTVKAMATKIGMTNSTVASATYTIEISVATPTFSPVGGTYIEAQSVTLSCATEGATIYYTTDGTEPTTSSAVYSSAINVSATTTIKAMAVKDGKPNSEIASATYTIIPPYVAVPTFSLEEGSYREPQTVTIACETADATIYYTTDGTVPTTSSMVYSNAISVNETMTIKAIAVKAGMTNSEVVSVTYTILPPSVATPTFTPAGGTYSEAQSVTISCETTGANIYYTTDGTNPTTSSMVYTGAINVSESTTIKAMGVKDGLSDSDVASASYIFDAITLSNIECLKKGKLVMPIGMVNQKQITGLQLDLYLPEGVTVATDSRGKMIISTTERMDGSYTISSNKMDGFVRILGYSADGDAFIGNVGDILNVTLNIGTEVADGVHAIRIKDIVLSDINSTEYHPADIEATLTVKSYTLGDVDDSGAININDVVCIINYILNRPNVTFIEAAADVDCNGSININDVVTLINRYILMRNNAPMLAPMLVSVDNNYLHLADIEIQPGETKEIQMLMTNADVVTASQGNIKLPAGLSFVKKANGKVDAANINSRSEDFTLSCAIQDDGSLSFGHYSGDGFNYDGNSGGIFTFKIKADENATAGTYSVDLSNVVLSIGGVGYDIPNRSSSITITGSTGIDTIGYDEQFEGCIYTLDGKKVEHLQKGLNIVRTKDGKVVKVLNK